MRRARHRFDLRLYPRSGRRGGPVDEAEDDVAWRRTWPAFERHDGGRAQAAIGVCSGCHVLVAARGAANLGRLPAGVGGMTPRVAVIVLSYNGLNLTRQCLD